MLRFHVLRLAEVRARADGPSEAKALLALAEVNADQRGSKKREEDRARERWRTVEPDTFSLADLESWKAGLPHSPGSGCSKRCQRNV